MKDIYDIKIIRNNLLAWAGLLKDIPSPRRTLTKYYEKFIRHFWVIPDQVIFGEYVSFGSVKSVDVTFPKNVHNKDTVCKSFLKSLNGATDYKAIINPHSFDFTNMIMLITQPSAHYANRMEYNRCRVSFRQTQKDAEMYMPSTMTFDHSFHGSDWDRHVTYYHITSTNVVKDNSEEVTFCFKLKGIA